MDLKQTLKDFWSAATLTIEQEAEGRIKETISTMDRKQADRIYLQAFAEYFSKKTHCFNVVVLFRKGGSKQLPETI